MVLPMKGLRILLGAVRITDCILNRLQFGLLRPFAPSHTIGAECASTRTHAIADSPILTDNSYFCEGPARGKHPDLLACIAKPKLVLAS